MNILLHSYAFLLSTQFPVIPVSVVISHSGLDLQICISLVINRMEYPFFCVIWILSF